MPSGAHSLGTELWPKNQFSTGGLVGGVGMLSTGPG